MQLFFYTVAGLLIALLLAGCSGRSVLTSYPAQLQPVRQAVATTNPAYGYDLLVDAEDSADAVLYNYELGRLASLSGDYKKSIRHFEKAFRIIENERRGAVVQLGESIEQGAALLLNDNAIVYLGFGYEKTLAHTYQALNYWMLDDTEGAAVELRRARSEQERLRKDYRSELEAAEKEAAREKLKIDREDVMTQLFDNKQAVSNLRSSFENAFTYYLSAILWEQQGRADEAYIDYKRALEIAPDNAYVAASTLRLAEKLVRIDDLKRFRQQYPSIQPADSSARLLIIYEKGFVPQKQSTTLPLYINGISYTVSLPSYSDVSGHHWPLKIQPLGTTAPLTNVGKLAAKALEEQYPLILTRQALRLAVKHELQKETYEESETAGILLSIFGIFLEKADQRSWLTLPESIQIADFFLPEGSYELTLNTQLQIPKTISVQLGTGALKIVRITQVGDSIYVQETGLDANGID